MHRYRQIVLHAGLGKTGSTSIQENCWRHRKWLLAQGIHYPAFELGGRRLVNHSDALSGAVCSVDENHGVNRRHQFTGDSDALQLALRNQLLSLLAEPVADTLLLSAESVANFTADESQALRQLLEPRTQKLRVIAYMRSPQSSLPSMFQQRLKGGNPVDATSLNGVIKERYQRLTQHFPGGIEWINFHEAIAQPDGLVGSLFATLGIPATELQTREFQHQNERVSQEACNIMLAINTRYPRDTVESHGVARLPSDLHALGALPGERFQLPNFLESPVYRAALEEAHWLEQALGFTFPPLTSEEAAEPWQWSTLAVLEEHVLGLNNPQLQVAAADYLFEQAQALTGARPRTAGALELISRRLQDSAKADLTRLSRILGADYFKFAALQAEPHNLELAHTLMSIAFTLKPDGSLIARQMESYRRRLDSPDKP